MEEEVKNRMKQLDHQKLIRQVVEHVQYLNFCNKLRASYVDQDKIEKIGASCWINRIGENPTKRDYIHNFERPDFKPDFLKSDYIDFEERYWRRASFFTHLFDHWYNSEMPKNNQRKNGTEPSIKPYDGSKTRYVVDDGHTFDTEGKLEDAADYKWSTVHDMEGNFKRGTRYPARRSVQKRIPGAQLYHEDEKVAPKKLGIDTDAHLTLDDGTKLTENGNKFIKMIPDPIVPTISCAMSQDLSRDCSAQTQNDMIESTLVKDNVRMYMQAQQLMRKADGGREQGVFYFEMVRPTIINPEKTEKAVSGSWQTVHAITPTYWDDMDASSVKTVSVNNKFRKIVCELIVPEEIDRFALICRAINSKTVDSSVTNQEVLQVFTDYLSLRGQEEVLKKMEQPKQFEANIVKEVLRRRQDNKQSELEVNVKTPFNPERKPMEEMIPFSEMMGLGQIEFTDNC